MAAATLQPYSFRRKLLSKSASDITLLSFVNCRVPSRYCCSALVRDNDGDDITIPNMMKNTRDIS
jgi:hypothetical protein